MIYGIGVDLVKNSRFFSWINDSKKIARFFNEKELLSDSENISDDRKCEYYATRYAAKEAFSKALGTGLRDMKLQDIWVSKDDQGCPFLNVSGNVKEILEKTGLVYHPELIKMFHKIGELSQEDNLSHCGTPSIEELTPAQILYGTNNK